MKTIIRFLETRTFNQQCVAVAFAFASEQMNNIDQNFYQFAAVIFSFWALIRTDTKE